MIDRQLTVGEVAAALPSSLPVFKTLGIDFCCGGGRRVADALREKDTTFEHFEAMLRQTREERGGRREANFLSMSPAVLTAYIEDTHHDYLRRALPETAELLTAVLRVHGRNHTELFAVYRLFGTLKAELEQHLIREETLLFPSLAQGGPRDPGTAALTPEIIAEHEGAGRLLEKLRQLTGEYAALPDACTSFRRAYALLRELEEDLHRHIHLENNILLKTQEIRPDGRPPKGDTERGSENTRG